MGVAIFAARKIALLNSISNLEMMRMQISSQSQALSDQACNLTMQQGNLQINALGMQSTTGTTTVNNNNVFGQLLTGLGGGIGSLLGGAPGGQIGSIGGSIFSSLLGGGSSSGSSSSGTDPNMIAMQQQNLQIQQQIMMIQQQEKRLEATAKQLETQLGLKNREYESVEKAEEKEIQRSAPKYGE